MTLATEWSNFEARYLRQAGQQQRNDMRVAWYTAALAVLMSASRDGSAENMNAMTDECRVFLESLLPGGGRGPPSGARQKLLEKLTIAVTPGASTPEPLVR